MSKYFGRLILVLMSPLIVVGFSLGTFIWWLMEGELSFDWPLKEIWNRDL